MVAWYTSNLVSSLIVYCDTIFSMCYSFTYFRQTKSWTGEKLYSEMPYDLYFFPAFLNADILSYLSNVLLRLVVCGSLFRVSKGVRDIPGNFQSATSNIPSGKALMYFGLFMATGVFFIFMAFTLFLPVIVLVPQKFAICFALGCSFIIGSFFALRGPKNQFAHMFSMEVFSFSPYCWSVLLSVYGYCPLIFSLPRHLYQRLPFTLGFIGSMMGTLYVSMALHSYILSVLFSVLQVFTLSVFLFSFRQFFFFFHLLQLFVVMIIYPSLPPSLSLFQFSTNIEAIIIN